jgi:putative endopeptidase
MKSSLPLRAALSACAFLVALTPAAPAGAAAPANSVGPAVAVAPDSPEAKASAARGFNVSNLDPSCPACTDFFAFATGGYAAAHPIPADKAYVGTAADLRDESLNDQRAVIEAAIASNPPSGSVAAQVAAFYAACMDTATIEKLDTAPLQPLLAQIDRISDRVSLRTTLAALHREGFGGFFDFDAEPDFKNSDRNILDLSQGGLGLPDRDYYFRDDAKSAGIRKAYQEYVGGSFALIGQNAESSAAGVASVMRVESALAKAARDRVALRDPQKNYNPTTLTALDAASSNFRWGVFFREVGAPPIVSLNVGQPEYFAAFDRLLADQKLTDLKAYLRWRVLRARPLALPHAFDDLSFAYSSKLSGQQTQRPRWKRCVDSTSNNLGEAVGQLYVAAYFSPEVRARAVTMVDAVQAALREDLSTLPWMSPATRTQAIAKLDAMTKKIGYPSKWKSYDFPVRKDAFFETLNRADEFEEAFDLARVGKPVDKTAWEMTPQTVNAYYNPLNNEIVFPAAIFRPPVFSAGYDDAINYGAVGSTIGHEMTHGFDDQGRQFDAKGNLRDWWTPEDAARYTVRADCVAKQFDALIAVDDVKQNGKLVLGEAIADLGGLKLAYLAFRKTAEAKAGGASIDGFTPDQRFFLGYASWHTWYWRPELARLIALTDPHPIDKNRVNATVADLPEFAAAFRCPANSPMVRPPETRCSIW